jgi:pimeloyl-ACP methyl ester carboxylesterase
LALALFCVLIAALVGAGWESDRSLAELSPRWAPPPSDFVELEGMQVHLRDQGRRDDPLPLLLIHGTSASLHTWEGWVEQLQSERRLISVDLPGFGLTGPDPAGDYRIERYVDFIDAVLNELELEQAVLVGNSLGGWIAWEYALAQPGRVYSLILIDAAGYGSLPKQIPIGFRLARNAWMRPLLEQLLPRFLVRDSVRQVYGDPTKVTEALVDRYFELSLREGNRGALFDRFAQGLGSPDNAARVARVSQPTLILWGELDQLIPLGDGQRFAADIEQAELVLLPGLGHVPHEEDPVASVNAVRGFLSGDAR